MCISTLRSAARQRTAAPRFIAPAASMASKRKQPPVAPADKERIRSERLRVLGASYKTTYDKALLFLRAEGQYMYDEGGRQYLDAYNNVPHVGHCHPKVVRAACEQLGRINSNTRYMHAHPVNYANRLCDLMPSEKLSVCYLVNSGSEANDLALRLALAYTKNRDVYCHDGAYHGTTMACAWLSPCDHYNATEKIRRPAWLQVLDTPNPFRGRFTRDDFDEPSGELAVKYVESAHAKLRARAKRGRCPAACYVESIMGVGGQVVYPKGYLRELAGAVRGAGGLLIADEVQTGFGRTGEHFWAFEEQDVVPDIVTMGKPMGNGYPLAAVFTSKEISDHFTASGEYFNTFGGGAVACATGMAVLDVLEEESLIANARSVGGYLLKKLKGLQAKHAAIGDVRGSGLFLGVEIVMPGTKEPNPALCKAFVNHVKENGILTSHDGPDQNVLRIKPPMCFTKANAKQILATLDTAMHLAALEVRVETPETTAFDDVDDATQAHGATATTAA